MMETKPQIRQHMLSQRQALDEQSRQEAAIAFEKALLHWLRERYVRAVAGYWPIRGELNVIPALSTLHSKGVSCALPIILPGQRELLFRQWTPETELRNGPYGIPSPSLSAPNVIPDCILVPLVACDPKGHRLGYGGGFYDATITAIRREKPHMHILGCGYRFQQLQALPVEAHDQKIQLMLV